MNKRLCIAILLGWPNSQAPWDHFSAKKFVVMINKKYIKKEIKIILYLLEWDKKNLLYLLEIYIYKFYFGLVWVYLLN